MRFSVGPVTADNSNAYHGASGFGNFIQKSEGFDSFD
jgi:hypothetical protein